MAKQIKRTVYVVVHEDGSEEQGVKKPYAERAAGPGDRIERREVFFSPVVRTPDQEAGM